MPLSAKLLRRSSSEPGSTARASSCGKTDEWSNEHVTKWNANSRKMQRSNARRLKRSPALSARSTSSPLGNPNSTRSSTRAAAADARVAAARINSSSTTPEAAFHPWSSNDAMKVAPKASPARFVSRGGNRLGNAAMLQEPGIAARVRVPHRASPRPIGHDQNRDLPAHLFAVFERLPLDSIAAQNIDRRRKPRNRKVAVEHVAHRRCEEPNASARRLQHARRQLVGQRGDDAKVARSLGKHGKRCRVDRRMTAAKADRQLVAELAARDQERPVGRTIGHSDRVVRDTVLDQAVLRLRRLVGRLPARAHSPTSHQGGGVARSHPAQVIVPLQPAQGPPARCSRSNDAVQPNLTGRARPIAGNPISSV